MIKNILTFVALTTMLLCPPANAQDAPTQDTEPTLSEMRQTMFDKLGEISNKLEGAEKHHFSLANSNYALISTVRTVQRDVGNAITACGENNPDMKPALNKRYNEWNAAITPIMDEAQGHLDNMIIAQDYAAPEDIKGIFKVMDDTRAKAESEIEKIPVTTPEACQYLIDKMDETQLSMTGLLRRTLISTPAK